MNDAMLDTNTWGATQYNNELAEYSNRLEEHEENINEEFSDSLDEQVETWKKWAEKFDHIEDVDLWIKTMCPCIAQTQKLLDECFDTWDLDSFDKADIKIESYEALKDLSQLDSGDCKPHFIHNYKPGVEPMRKKNN